MTIGRADGERGDARSYRRGGVERVVEYNVGSVPSNRRPRNGGRSSGGGFGSPNAYEAVGLSLHGSTDLLFLVTVFRWVGRGAGCFVLRLSFPLLFSLGQLLPSFSLVRPSFSSTIYRPYTTLQQ